MPCLHDYEHITFSKFMIWKTGGYRMIKYKVKHLLYRYFPENFRLWMGIVLHTGLSCIQINTLNSHFCSIINQSFNPYSWPKILNHISYVTLYTSNSLCNCFSTLKMEVAGTLECWHLPNKLHSLPPQETLKKQFLFWLELLRP